MSSTDYATAFGYHSTLAAVVFAIVYLPIFLWFVLQSVRNTTYVYISLSVFCLSQYSTSYYPGLVETDTT